MQYRNQTFEKRFEIMGDTSENVFRKWATKAGINFVPYGLNRPPFDFFRYLPAEIRHTPDFLCEQSRETPVFPKLRTPKLKFARHLLVEIKGCGKDQLIKIKHAEFETMQKWEAFTDRPILVWAFDSHKQRVSTSLIGSRIAALSEIVATGYYNDGGPRKPYWAIPTKLLEWEPWIEPNDV